MVTHTIDVRATLTLHVEARSADEARSKVLDYGSRNPDVTIADGVVVHELSVEPGSIEYVHAYDDEDGDVEDGDAQP